MRNPRIQAMDRSIESFYRDPGIQLQVKRIRHRNFHVVPNHSATKAAGDRLKAECILLARCQEGRVAPEAASAITAHFSFAAVGIIVTESEISITLGRLHHEQAIRSNAPMPIANPGDLPAVEMNGEVPVVDDDEVVSGSVHFGKRETHVCDLNMNWDSGG